MTAMKKMLKSIGQVLREIDHGFAVMLGQRAPSAPTVPLSAVHETTNASQLREAE